MGYENNVIPNSALITRYDFTTSTGGIINIDKVNSAWYMYFATLNTVNITNSGIIETLYLTSICSNFIINNVGIGQSSNQTQNAFDIRNCFQGGTITNCVVSRYTLAANLNVIYTANNKDISISNVKAFGLGIRSATTTYIFFIINSDNITLTNITSIGSIGVYVSAVKTITLTNLIYADNITGTTSTSNAISAISVTGKTDNFIINGVFLLPGVDNVHPRTSILTSGTSSNITLKNVGSPSSLFNCGTANAMQYIFYSAGNNLNIIIKKVYVDDISSFIYSFNSSDIGITSVDVWGNQNDTIALASINTILKGNKALNSIIVQNNCYGTNWFTTYVGISSGRVGIWCNENSTDSTYNGYSIISGSPKFNSAGQVLLRTVGDKITWETPYYIKGYTSFANSGLTLTGTNPTTKHTYWISIDKNDGNGWSASSEALRGNISGLKSVDPNLGFKARLTAICVTGATDNALTCIRWDMKTNSISQQITYPDEYILTLTSVEKSSQGVLVIHGTESLIGDIAYELNNQLVFTHSGCNTYTDIRILKSGLTWYEVPNYQLQPSSTSFPVVQEIDLVYVNGMDCPVIFSSQSHRIVVTSGTSAIGLPSLYTKWVDWALSGSNLKYQKCFETVGGNEIATGKEITTYYYLKGDWRLRPGEGNKTLSIVSGNFLMSSNQDPIVNTLGCYNVRTRYENTLYSETISTGGGGGGTTAAEVWTYGTRTLTTATGGGGGSAYISSQLNLISSQVREIHSDSTVISSQTKDIHSDLYNISSQIIKSTKDSIYGISANAKLTRTELLNLSSQNIKPMHLDINWISSQVDNIFPSAAIIIHGNNYWKSSNIQNIPSDVDTTLSTSHGIGNWEGLGGSTWISSQLISISSQNKNIGFDTDYISGNSFPSGDIIHHGDLYWRSGQEINAASVWGYATRTLTDDTTVVDWISSQIMAISSQYSPADVWSYSSRTLSDDTTVINWISSQAKNIFPSGDIIRHGDTYWRSGSGGVVDLSTITPEIDYISSQMKLISSQISGLSTGGGSTPAQIWSYTIRELTGDTGAIDYISSQIGYVSSASEKYGYGGGKGTSVAVVGGRKSPWTHKLRDDIIKNVEETKQMVVDINKKITNYYNDEMKAIDALVNSLEGLYTKIKSTTKNDTDKVLNEIEYSIKVLKENREKLRNINTINEIPNIKKEIVKVSAIASKLLSSEMVEELILEGKKEEKEDG